MDKQDLTYILWDLAKIVGGVVKDTLNVRDYRITVLIEKKVNDKTGVVVHSMSFDKRMSALEAETITRRLKELIEKK